MTKVRLLALLAVVALILFPAIAFAQVAPQLPCAFYGTVTINGGNMPNGTLVTAMIGNETYSATTYYTTSEYKVVIAQPEGKDYRGLPVTFKIGSDTVLQKATWTMGDAVPLDLIKGTGPITPGGSVINGVKLGNSTGYDPTTGFITIKQSDITGAKGDMGATGQTGPEGPAGKNASSVIGIIAIIIAIIAVAIAGMVMMRKPQKP